MTAKEAMYMQKKELGDLIEFKPDLVFVVIGGNDITDKCDSATVFTDIMNLVRTLRDAGIERVYASEILHRADFRKASGMTE